ncbi:DUF6907 domain-containing protein [Streptomyces sp. NPDC004609]|uniref:DUF6907 domain-containing protein n=1 Tax=Streptomyces sp. NPDC004609 TaxID=3364704 RepID=UPI0036B43122
MPGPGSPSEEAGPMPTEEVLVPSSSTVQPTATVCPDGRTFCTGLPIDHAGSHDHSHHGPEYSLCGSYLGPGPSVDSILGFGLVQWGDGRPRVAFSADGTWPELDLPQVDELINGLTGHLERLRVTRDELAVLLGEEPKRVTAPAVRAEVAELVVTRARTYGLQGDDPRLPSVRSIDIERAAHQGIEDAVAMLGHERQRADVNRRPVRSDISIRLDHRLGTMLVAFEPAFEACLENSVQQGTDAKEDIAQLAGALTWGMCEAAHAASQAAEQASERES